MNSITTDHTIRQVRDLHAGQCSVASVRKEAPSEPHKAVIVSDAVQEQQIQTTTGERVEDRTLDSNSDNISSMKELCKALSKKLALKQQDKQKDRLERLLQLVKQSNGEYHVENYGTFNKIVDTQIFSRRIPISNILIEEVTFKEFAQLYFKSIHSSERPLKMIEKEELEKRYGLKHMSTHSNFRPSKQSIEIQTSSGNETILGGTYHDSIYCFEMSLPKMQTKSFILLEANSVDSKYRYKQTLHVFRVYGDDLFSKHTFNQSRNLCDIIIHFQ